MDGAEKLSWCLQTQALGTGSATAWHLLFQSSSPMRVPKAWGNPWLSITGRAGRSILPLPAFPAMESHSVQARCACCAWESPGHLSGLALLLTLHGCDYSPITKLEDYEHNNAQRNY